jgi:glutathione S-transferase
LHFGAATLTFPQTIVLRYERFETQERRLPQTASDYRRWFLGRLRTLEPLLAGSASICGDRFTMADISVDRHYCWRSSLDWNRIFQHQYELTGAI